MGTVLQQPTEIESLKTNLFIQTEMGKAAQRMCEIKDIEITRLRRELERAKSCPIGRLMVRILTRKRG